MATRLASVFKKKAAMESEFSSDAVKETQAVRRKAKKVTFCPESGNEVFEFTPSVKKPRRKNVRSRSQEGPAHDIQQGGTELRRSKRLVANAITGSIVIKKDCSLLDVSKARNFPRRSGRIGFSGRGIQEQRNVMALEQSEAKKDISRRSTRLAVKSCMGSGTSKEEPLLPAKRFKRLVDIGNKEDPDLIKDIDCDVQTTGKHRRMKVQNVSIVEKVPRRRSPVQFWRSSSAVEVLN